jgi:restriction system protein
MRTARFSLKKQGFIDEVSKFTYQITEEGIELLNDNAEDINEEIKELEKLVDPFEVVEEKVEEIENDLVKDLIDQLKQAHWRRLETIVVELMTAMGYGDGQVTEKTNDGGLDGIIKEDKLGLDNIYIQAKKWENSVGRPEVMSFSGALDAKGARKGIFITTSTFTSGAKEYVERLETKKIILIDGKRLAKLMIENNIGVGIKKKFVVKEVDFTYFEGE